MIASTLLPESARGSTMPRLWTRPLITGAPGPCGCGCALDESTTYGFAVVQFAQTVLRMPLDAWQRWIVIHAGEILPDGRPRFRKLLIIVARQNGKTHLLKVLTLFWLFVDQWPMIMGQSTTLSMAREVWESAQAMARQSPELVAEYGTVRKDNNDPHWRAASGAKYKIAASTRRGARSLSVDRLVMDELREHQNWESYNASMPTLNARPYAQAWLISNQGDDTSVVLESLRERGIRQMAAVLAELGVQQLEPELREALVKARRADRDDEITDDEIGLFEYSAPPGAPPDSPAALLAANPNAGDVMRGARVSLRSLISDARSAMEGDLEELAKFRTEILCQRVHALDAALDPDGWALGLVPGTLDDARARLAACLDVAPDQRHVSLVVAASLADGKVRGEVVASWVNITLMKQELPDLLKKIRPRALGYFPNGPAASVAAAIPAVPGVKVEEIRGEVHEACMGLAELVMAGELLHSGQELLTAHALAAGKLWKGDVWRFGRTGGHCDATYALAGAAHLARTMPAGPGRPRLVVAGSK
jgi:hypothetical protein